MRTNHIVKIRLSPWLAAVAAFVWIAASPPVVYGQFNNDEWDRKTIVTFNDPVEIGGVVLPPGTYMLKVMDMLSNRQVIRISSENETNVYATAIGTTKYRTTVSDNCEFGFYEAASGAPKALRSWFYHARRSGIEFAPPRRAG